MTKIQQRLPTEIVLLILEYAIHENPWQPPTLICVNKQIGKQLKRQFSMERLHLRSMRQLLELGGKGWPSSQKDGKKTSVDKKGRKLALYLHLEHYVEDLYNPEDENDSCFFRQLDEYLLLQGNKDQIETLGLRSKPTDIPEEFLGLYASRLLPNLRRLYIDMSRIPARGDEARKEYLEWQSDISTLCLNNARLVTSGNEWECRKKTAHRMRTQSQGNHLEVFAYTGFRLKGNEHIFPSLQHGGEFVGLWRIRDHFASLKRLYLFSMSSDKDHQHNEELDRICPNFATDTRVENIFHVVIQLQDGEADKIFTESNSAIVLPSSTSFSTISSATRTATGMPRVNVVKIAVERKRGQRDMLGLMRRVIDDLEAEWAPNHFKVIDGTLVQDASI